MLLVCDQLYHGSQYWTINNFQAFLDGEQATLYLNKETKEELLLAAVTEITNRYYELAADLVSVVSIQLPIWHHMNYQKDQIFI